MKKNDSDPHAPNRFRTYREVHSTVINQFKDRGFILLDSLEFLPVGRGIWLSGRLDLRSGLVLTVEKLIAVIEGFGDDAIVQTSHYAYNLSIGGLGNVFRYDNQDDDYLREGHLDCHHKHVFNWVTGLELGASPQWVGRNEWPTLGQVIAEAEDWYWLHHVELANLNPPSLEL